MVYELFDILLKVHFTKVHNTQKPVDVQYDKFSCYFIENLLTRIFVMFNLEKI